MDAPENKLRFRPRFREQVRLKPNVIKENISAALKQHNTIGGEIIENHVILKIPKSQQHYWSPQLSLELEENEEGTLIRGLFGPKPGVWTMFVFFYSAIGFLTMLGLIFGLSQLMLKMEPFGLYTVPVGAVILIGLLMISKIGQKLSYDQMSELRSFVDEAIR